MTTFDLALIEEDDRPAVEAATRHLHELERRTGEAIIEIGRTLLDVRDRIGHGRFRSWLSEEFEWSHDTARRFMQVADRFGDMTQIASFAPSALYALASGSVPDEVREEFIRKAESGETVRHKDVQERLAADKRFAIVDLDSGEVMEDEYAVKSEVVDGMPPPSPNRNYSTQMAPAPINNKQFIETLVDSLPTTTVEAFAAGIVEAAVVPVMRESLSVILRDLSKARMELSTIKDRGRLQKVLAEDDVSRDTADRCIEIANIVTSSLRDVLGHGGEKLRRVS